MNALGQKLLRGGKGAKWAKNHRKRGDVAPENPETGWRTYTIPTHWPGEGPTAHPNWENIPWGPFNPILPPKEFTPQPTALPQLNDPGGVKPARGY